MNCPTCEQVLAVDDQYIAATRNFARGVTENTLRLLVATHMYYYLALDEQGKAAYLKTLEGITRHA